MVYLRALARNNCLPSHVLQVVIRKPKNADRTRRMARGMHGTILHNGIIQEQYLGGPFFKELREAM